ncbi:two-component regulator propeller domain-containing protein [Chitinophaga sp. CF118]|uniref:two-component regulator propeller domain-containing protein n=1 Tax=Chitinophaga sp. CF118 TaxID=1884367 RepID=UPI000B7D2DAB|nr:two-component regulator propeller domain-containing protein [Chitinophaga sp. CF118]
MGIKGTGTMLALLIIITNGLFATGYPVRYLGIEDGLSNNAVVNVYQDYKGFMWFGTYDGLNRYDGYKCKIYRNKIGDTTSLLDNGIYTIEGDANYRLWIGGRKGLSIFNPLNEHFSPARYAATGKTVEGNIHIIKAGKGGIILVGSENNGLLLFEGNPNTGRKIPIGKSTNYEVTAIDYDIDSTAAWIFAQDIGLCRYDCRTRTITIINTEIKWANCLKFDRNGHLWLGTDQGLFKFDHTFSPNYLEQSCKIVNLCVDKQGEIWVASDGNGIFLVNNNKAVHNKQPLSSNSVYSIYEDREGRKWIGTLRGGVNIIEPRQNLFEQHAFNNGGVNNFILSFCEGEGKNIWIGTDGGGLKLWNRETNTVKDYTLNPAVKNSISSNFITGILHDSHGDLWVATWFGGINRYNKQTDGFDHFRCFNPFTNAEENNLWIIYEDAQKNIWASTTNNGTLYLFNRNTDKFELFDKSLVNIQCLAEDRKGNIWGGNYSSLVKIDRVNKKHRIYPIGYTVRTIHEDQRGNLWVGTEGGLLLFNTQSGKFIRFTDADGLPGNSILRLLEDNKGYLWLSTFNGLARFDPVHRTSRNFSQSDGLQSNQFAFNAALKLTSGEFMFGGIKGFNIFYPDSIYERNRFSPVFLTGIRINNIPVEQNDTYVSERSLENVHELRIPYNKAAVSLDFVALEYSSPDKISYAYLLDGWDKMWNYSGEARTANYTRLQEGDYTFKIKATNPDGQWGEEIRLLRIIILPPWYRTWWAYGLYVAFVLLGIYLFTQYRSRQERLKYEIKLAHLENEKEKEINERKLSFFTNISHEFRTPLTLIINPLKELKDNENLGVVYRNARRLLSLVDQLLLFRKADSEGDRLKITKLDLVALCNEVFLCFTQQAATRHINYQFIYENEHIDIYADYEKIEIALFNLLSNAFKFTPDGGEILCKIRHINSEVEIMLKDSGSGIQANMGDKIFEKFQQADSNKSGFGIGLYLVKHFVEKHEGTVTWSSQINEGTTFLIRLKTGTEHLDPALLTVDPGSKSGLLEELIEDVYSKPVESLPPVELITEKRSILLIDDNAEIRHYLQQLFIDKYIVYEADNGTEGFAAVQQYMPDLVISDIQMEGMDGVELCTKIKQTEAISHIPVILLTSASSADTRLKGIEGGADDYITKPFDRDLLLVKVQTIIKNRNLLRQYFLESITLKQSYVKVPAEYQHFLKQCIDIVEANLGNEDFSIKTFTQAIGMSHSSLYKKVKSISGQTVNAFIRFIRLRRAAVLMLKGNYTINQAAFEVGIGDVKYFREQFFKLFGMNPSDYVKKYRHSFNQDLNVIRGEI